MPSVTISPDAKVGNHTHMYANSFLGHNSEIGDYCFIANNAAIGAMVKAEEGAYFGTNCSIRERVTIGRYAIIGMGAVVLNDVEPYTIVAGNPARKIGEINA